MFLNCARDRCFCAMEIAIVGPDDLFARMFVVAL
jgi:hypothetical protein